MKEVMLMLKFKEGNILNYVYKFLLISVFIIFCFNSVQASEKEYTIDDYYVDITVNSDNTYNVIEKITANFKVEKHGIKRNIPIIYGNGQKKNNADITNITVNQKYKTYQENNNLVLQIGEDNKTVIGNKDYIIKYTYDIGNDNNDGFDEFYYNIIGNSWDTTIKNIVFRITMPKIFDASKISFFVGANNSDKNIEYDVKGNAIIGRYTGKLNEKEAITIRVELKEGYFKKGLHFNAQSRTIFGVSFIALSISFILWWLFGKNYKVVETVEFYPPNNVNSLELAHLYKGKVTTRDVMSLLIYLASKGYIKIEEESEELDKIYITKLKEYDGHDRYEEEFLKGLFKNENKRTLEDLRGKFYRVLKRIQGYVNSEKKQNTLYEYSKSATFSKYLILALSILPFFVLLFTTYTRINGQIDLKFLTLAVIPIVIYLSILSAKNPDKEVYSKIVVAIILLGVFLQDIIFSVYSDIFRSFENATMISNLIFCILCFIVMYLAYRSIPRRNIENVRDLGRIKGFKRFLKIAEKEQLEALIEKDPTYFYNVLPYAYVLGVTEKWICKFETITIPPSEWYSTDLDYDIGRIMDITISTLEYADNTGTNGWGNDTFGGDSSDSGSSGDYCSGGGAGGGGGSSW